MNSVKDRLRKNSMYDASPPAIVASQAQIDRRRRRSFHSKRNSRDKDFFAPDQIEEWVLPEYKSLFHHLFIKEEEDSGCSTTTGLARRHSISSPNRVDRNRRISPAESTQSAPSASTEGDGTICNLMKSFPAWIKKVFHISEETEQQQTEEEREAWLEEIPIDICDRLRHIHIYVT